MIGPRVVNVGETSREGSAGHLSVVIDRLKREFEVEASVGRPTVAYLETLTRSAEGTRSKRVHLCGRVAGNRVAEGVTTNTVEAARVVNFIVAASGRCRVPAGRP